MDMKAARITNTKRISIKRIQCNEFELHEKKRGIKVLRESIAKKGLLVPITVRYEGDHYIIVDGIKRFAAWKEEYPDQPIFCTVLSYEADGASTSDGEVPEEQMKQDAFTINLARAKVPKKQVEAYVKELHSQGMGYKAIAQCIGYKKSGVQKIVERIKAQKDGDGSAPPLTTSKTIGTIKRVRTMLKNLSEALILENESDKSLFRNIEDFLKVHEELLQEEKDKEKPPVQDTPKDTTATDTTENQPSQE